MAGSRVRVAATATSTAMPGASASAWSRGSPPSARLARAATTAQPAKATALPEAAVVRAAASSTDAPSPSSSRKRVRQKRL